WPQAQARGQAGQYSFTTLAGMPGGRGNADGVGSAAGFTAPAGVAVDSVHNAYVSDTANHTIRKVSPSGVVTTLAGSAGQAGAVDGSASTARFYNPSGVTLDNAGSLYVADTGNHTIRRITLSNNMVTTFAGSAGLSGNTDGTGTAARF